MTKNTKNGQMDNFVEKMDDGKNLSNNVEMGYCRTWASKIYSQKLSENRTKNGKNLKKCGQNQNPTPERE